MQFILLLTLVASVLSAPKPTKPSKSTLGSACFDSTSTVPSIGCPRPYTCLFAEHARGGSCQDTTKSKSCFTNDTNDISGCPAGSACQWERLGGGATPRSGYCVTLQPSATVGRNCLTTSDSKLGCPAPFGCYSYPNASSGACRSSQGAQSCFSDQVGQIGGCQAGFTCQYEVLGEGATPRSGFCFKN